MRLQWLKYAGMSKVVICLSILMFSCQRDRVVEVAAGRAITLQEVRLIQQINRLQLGMDTSYGAALLYLRKTWYCVALSDSLGAPITDSVLCWEAQRIARSTHMPWRLDSIRRACGDSATYVRLFVLPQLAQRWLYYHYYWDSTLHRNCRMAAEQCLKVIAAGMPHVNVYQYLSGLALEQVARKHGYRFARWKADAVHGIIPWHIAPSNGKSDISDQSAPPPVKIPVEAREAYQSSLQTVETKHLQQLIYQVLRPLPMGKVYPRPVEWHQEFWVVQLIDTIGGTYYFAAIHIPENDFFPWFEKHLSSTKQ